MGQAGPSPEAETGAAVLIVATAVLVADSAARLAGTDPALPAALTLGAAALILLAARPGLRLRHGLYGGLVLGAGIAWGAVAGGIYDRSFDGQAYHLPAVIALAASPTLDGHQTGLWEAALYPQGIWRLEALLGRLAGDPEAAKLLYPVMTLAVAPPLVAALRRLGAGRVLAPAAALAMLGCPVLVGQFASFMVDGYVHLLILALLAGLVLAQNGVRPLGLALAAASAVLLIGAKLQGGFFAGLIVAAAILVDLLRRRFDWRLPAALLSAGVIGIAIVGYHPFITNLAELGTVSNDILVGTNRAGGMPGLPPPLRLVRSLYSRTDGGPVDTMPVWKYPFEVHAAEFRSAGDPDPRIGGFGPFFAGAFTLGLGLAIAALVAGRRRAAARSRALLLYGAAFVLIAAVFPESWWARFVPLVWDVPVLFAVAAVLAWPGWLARAAAACVILLAVAGTIAAAVDAQDLTRSFLRRTEPILAGLAAGGQGVAIVPAVDADANRADLAWANRLDRLGIANRTDPGAACAQPVLQIVGITLCPAPPG